MPASTAEPEPGALVERSVADHDLGDAGGDGHRGLHDGARRGSAAVRDAGEEGEVLDADVAGDLDLFVLVDGESDHAVDVGRGEPGVVERGLDRLAGELHFAAAGLLGEFGLADPGDRGFAAQAALMRRPR